MRKSRFDISMGIPLDTNLSMIPMSLINRDNSLSLFEVMVSPGKTKNFSNNFFHSIRDSFS